MPRGPVASARILVLDNYDSFTFNIVAVLQTLGADVDVVPSDRLDVAGIRSHAPDGLLISPGPCTPDQAGISLEAIEALAGELPILGVCLGHQAIAQCFGGRVRRASEPVHGRTSAVRHDGAGLFSGLPSPLVMMRYHSLVVDAASLPAVLVPTAWTAEGELMGLRHRSKPLEGLQFHPESFMSEGGEALFGAWLRGLAT